jgi:hypothetical protein
MKKIVILLLIAITISCEKDDICDENTATTSRIVIEFYDATITTNTKNVTNLKVTGLDENGDELTDAYDTFNGESVIKLPLKTTTTTTKYSLVLNSNDPVNINKDFVEFNYSTQEVYVSRACGYKTIFELNQGNPFVLSDSTTPDGQWIQQINIEQTTIDNENETHVKIYY